MIHVVGSEEFALTARVKQLPAFDLSETIFYAANYSPSTGEKPLAEVAYVVGLCVSIEPQRAEGVQVP